MCSYCGCESITVIGRFMDEHVSIINALGDLRRACVLGEPATVHRAVAVLHDLLEPHARAEEVGLFSVLAEDEEFTAQVDGLCREHAMLHQLLDRVGAGSHTHLPDLERMLRAHIDREENGLFPAAAIGLDGPEWERVDALTPDQVSVRK